MFLIFLFILICIVFIIVLFLFYNWRGTVVLLYHKIAIPDSKLSKDLKRFYVQPKNFKKQIEWLLKNRFNFVTLRQAKEFIDGKIRLPKKSIAITFDDGYRNIYKNIYPFLKEKNIPAAVFIVVNGVGGNNYWSNKEIQEYLLSWEEIGEMQKARIDFQSHAMTHRDLTSLNNEELTYEIVGSKLKLEDKLRMQVSFLAFPWGASNAKVLEEAEKAGYFGVCALRRGLNRRKKSSFLIKRIEIRYKDNMLTFILKINFPIVYDIARSIRKSLSLVKLIWRH